MHREKWKVTQQVASNMIVVFSGIGFYLALSHFDAVRQVFGNVVGIISPFIWGIVLAYLLDGGVRVFERTIFKNQKGRGLAVLATYCIAVLFLFVLLSVVLPQLAQSVMGLFYNIPVYLESLNQLVRGLAQSFGLQQEALDKVMGSYQGMISDISNLASRVLPQVFSYSMAIGSGLFTGITALISSVYMLLSKKMLLRQMKKIVYALMPLNAANRFLAGCQEANAVFGGFIIGKILDSAIIGVLCFIGTSLLRMPYALLISVIVGITNIIPYFGPFIGAIPSTFILLIVDPIKALEFLVFILVLQQLDGNVIGPRILGDSTGLPALWVLVSIIVGQGLLGFVGMVIGVPTFALLYSFTRRYLNAQLARKQIDEAGNPLLPAPGAEETE
ncbi:MAG: AI-2E family transporter [Oscillospiraceae bacterium]|nr:AI-2E family transporter [Oscillospiraceae bacterium]